jgi:hypothetical protein
MSVGILGVLRYFTTLSVRSTRTTSPVSGSAAALARACAQIDTILGLSPAERGEMIALISPLVAAQTRDALLAGWLSVQGSAADSAHVY